MASKLFEWLKTSTNDYFSHYEIQKNDSAWENIGTNEFFEWINIPKEEHSFRVRAVNIRGKLSNILEWNFEVIDNTSINKVSITDDTYLWNKIFVWELTSGSLDHYEVSKDGGSNWENIGTDTSYTWNDISDGTQTFIVKGIDVLSNETEIQWEFTINIELIIISKVTPDFSTLTL